MMGKCQKTDKDAVCGKEMKRCLKPGDDLVVAGYAGLEGTSVLASLFSDRLKAHFPEAFLREIPKTVSRYRLDEEGKAIVHSLLSDCTAWLAAEEGGIMNALWELSRISGTGLEADLLAVPVRQETIELCDYFSLNPYRLLCGDVWVAGALSSARLVRELQRAGLPCAVIGTVTPGPARILTGAGTRRFLERPAPDELKKVIS